MIEDAMLSELADMRAILCRGGDLTRSEQRRALQIAEKFADLLVEKRAEARQGQDAREGFAAQVREGLSDIQLNQTRRR